MTRRITAVVAAWNEEDTIEELTRRLHAALAALPGFVADILYVVEGTDGTRARLDALADELGGIRVLYQEQPQGIGHAFRRGFAALGADVDFVVTMDADLNHQPEEIHRLLAAADGGGADIAVGSRFVAGSRVDGTPGWKRLLSTTMNRFMRRLYGLEVGDKTSGFRVYRSAALRDLSFDSDGYAFLPEMLVRAHAAGMGLVEVPIHFVFRRQGESKMGILSTTVSYLTLLGRRRRRTARRASVQSDEPGPEPRPGGA